MELKQDPFSNKTIHVNNASHQYNEKLPNFYYIYRQI